MRRLTIAILFLSIAHMLTAQFASKEILSERFGNAEQIIQSNSSTRYIVAGKGDKYAQVTEVNQIGMVFRQRNFKNVIGVAERSEFTDVVNNGNGYTFVGDCDGCRLGDPRRKILLLKTDSLFNVQRINRLDAPSGSELAEDIFGWQKIARDGNDFIIASQLSKIVANDTFSNIALTKFNANLDTIWHKRYDWNRYDNLGDLSVRNGRIYLLTWGVSYFGIGGDSTHLHVLDNAGADLASFTYTGVGLSLSPIIGSQDWVIGGALTTDLVNGPQCLLRRIDKDGNIVNSYSWGTPRIDAVRDVVATDDGNLLVAATFWQNFPDLNQLIAMDNYLSYQDIEYPHVAKVQRVNSATLRTTGMEHQVPGAPSTALIVRSVVPVNANGSYFVGCGYQNNRNMFYSYTEDGAKSRDNQYQTQVSENFTATVFPNPAQKQEGIQVQINADFSNYAVVNATLVDITGRVIQNLEIHESGLYQFAQTNQAGLYLVHVTKENKLVETIKVMVQN